MKTTLFSLLLVISNIAFCQNQDSIRIEEEFLSSIGNFNKLDSLEKAVLKNMDGDFILEDTYWYNLSKSRFLSGQIDKAFEAAEKGLKLCEKNKKEFKQAKFYNLKASVYAFRKDNEKAIKSFNTALAIVEKKNDFKTAASIRNNIANIFFGLSDFESAYKYSLLAYNQLVKDNDTINLPGVTGILAISSLKIGQTEEGVRLANKSIHLALKYKNPIGLIVGYHSLGESFNEQEKYSKAIAALEESLKYSEMYRQSHFVMLNKLALQHSYFMVGNYAKSIEYGLQAKVETENLNNGNTSYAINKNLAYAYEKIGDKTLAFNHLSEAHQTYITSSGIQNQKAINDILIKYDTEKKEKDLVLSRLENIENQNKLYKRAQWIILLGVILFLVIISYYFYNRLQKQRLVHLKKEQESKRLMAAINAEENERERISNELHDGMASSITGLKMKLEDLSMDENGEQLKPLVDQLRKLHDETRRMSHNLMPLGLNNENWIERLKEYCLENTSQNFKIQFINNLKKSVALDPSISILLYRSIQELIHNAQKHSKAKACIVQISKLEDEIILSIEDEGIGFQKEKGNGQGLTNMRNRLLEIGALLEIESKLGEGSLFTISLKPTK